MKSASEKEYDLKKQSFLQGSVILIISAVLAKIAGALFKIPLTGMLGGTGMGYFSCAYGLFLPMYALTATGLTTAVAKLTAESCAKGNYKNVRKIHRVALIAFTGAGIPGTVITALLAKPFAEHVTSSPKAYLSVLMIAPSVLFGCITAVYRGCHEGMRNMYPTAVSQTLEAAVKLGSGLFLCSYTLKHWETVKEFLPEGTDPLAGAAAAAVMGISLSTLAGTLFLFVRGTGIERGTPTALLGHEESGKSILKEILKIMIPVALGSLVTNLTSLIDLATIIRCLDSAVVKAPQKVCESLETYSIDRAELSNFVYGCFTGLAVTIFNLVPSVTNMFGKGILPNLTHAWACRDKAQAQKLSEEVIRATAFIAVPSGLGITVLAPNILEFLYPSRPIECAASADSLSVLGLGVIFLSLSFPLFSMLQAVGKADLPVKLMLAGVAVKLTGNLLLIPIPEINISGAALSTTLCYAVIFILAIWQYGKHTGIKIPAIKILLPSFISGGLCAAAALMICKTASASLGNTLCLPLGIAAGGVVYLAGMKLTAKKENR